MEYGMSLVHVYGHQNSGKLASTLTPRLDTLEEHIMVDFLLSSAIINTIAIGLSDLHEIPILSIHRDPVHSIFSVYRVQNL